MDSKKSLLTVSLFICISLIIPAILIAEEPLSEVLIVVKKDEVLAFSSPKNNWVSENLSRNEKVSHQDSKGNVAVIATNFPVAIPITLQKQNTRQLFGKLLDTASRQTLS